ncbi:MAG: helix-turn-helix domain-containing protein, partial [Acidimicrobiales bacterium]
MSTCKEEFMVKREKFMEEIDDLLSGWPVWLSVTQSAEILNISRTSVYRLLEGGDLDA